MIFLPTIPCDGSFPRSYLMRSADSRDKSLMKPQITDEAPQSHRYAHKRRETKYRMRDLKKRETHREGVETRTFSQLEADFFILNLQ